MRHTRFKPLIVAVCALSFAACGGGGSGSATPPLAPAKPNAQLAPVSIRIAVPGTVQSNARLRHIESVSENTQGVLVTAYVSGTRTNPIGTASANIAAGSPDCTNGANGARTCTFSMQAPPGNDDFVVATYDVAPPNFTTANQLGEGVATQTIVAGTPATIPLTLNSVLAKVQLGLTPPTVHTLIPSQATVDVYALDADSDVIVGNAFYDGSGNAVTLTLGINNDLSGGSGALALATTTLNGPSANGVQLNYNGGATVTATTPVTITATPSNAVPAATATLSAVYPTFTSISDPNLSVNNLYHGGIVFDTQGGAYYSTPSNFGGISYYNGTGSSITDNYAATGSQPVRGGLASSPTGSLYVVSGTQGLTFAAPPSSTITPVANASAAPIPNGSGLAYDSVRGSLWYASGSLLVDYPVASGAPTTTSLGVNTTGGISIDASDNVWVIDSINNQLLEYGGSSHSLQPGGSAFDVLANANGIWITDHGFSPGIVQCDTSGNYITTYSLPNGGTPFYLMPDNAQPGVLWFDYLLNGQIGIGRMDTNGGNVRFAVATDTSGPFGSQAGAIGAASDGSVYMVFDGTSTLVQVER